MLRVSRLLNLIIAAILLAFSAVPVPGALAQGAPTGVITIDSVAVRNGPAESYEIIARVNQGNTVTLLSRDPGGNWVKVMTPRDGRGWVKAQRISTSYPISALPVEGTPLAFADRTSPNIRSGPGDEFAIIGQVSGGTLLTLLARDEGVNWLRVLAPNGLQGWIRAAAIVTGYRLRNLPVERVDPENPTATVNVAVLNVRGGPGIGHAVITQITQGMVITMRSRVADSSWVRVALADGTRGWVFARYLSSGYAIDRLPLNENETGTPTAVVNATALNLRSGPGIGYSVIRFLYRETILTLLARNADGSWVKVSLISGVQGWVSARYLATSYPVMNLPVGG